MDILDAEQTAWIDGALSSIGRPRAGGIDVFRSEPWATVSRFSDTTGRTVWFKANKACFRHEAALISMLGSAASGSVLAPLASDSATGWFLTDDGGPLAMAADGLAIAETYARVQVASADLVVEMLAAGVPDRRPAALGDLFDTAVSHPEAGTAGDRCASLRDRFDRVCDVLSTDGRLAVADSDMGPHHAFVGPPLRLFDWGDAVVTHPLVALFNVGRQLEPGPEAVALVAEAWGADVDGRVAEAAAIVARLLGADVWMRVPAESWQQHPGGIERWVERLVGALVEKSTFS